MITSITSLAVSPTTKTLNICETVQLTGTVNPSLTTEGVQWISSNTSVAIVSDSGLVTAKASGTATITFKNSSGTKSATCKITVLEDNIVLGTSKGYLDKYDSNGNKLWSRQYINQYLYTDAINAVATDLNENIIVGTGKGYLDKYDGNGNKLWSTQYINQYLYTDAINIVVTDLNENIIVGTNNGYLDKYDSNGKKLWSTQYINQYLYTDTINAVAAGTCSSSGHHSSDDDDDDDD